MRNRILIALLAFAAMQADAASKPGYANAQFYPYTYVANSGSPGAAIPATFVGLSLEVSAMVQTTSLNNNTGLKNILSVLGSSGNVRIGGNTTDSTTPSTARVTDAANFILGLGAGWTAIYSVGCIQTVPNIQAEVGAFNGVVATSYYAIGNEPNFYNSGACSPDSATFQTQWASQRTSILASVPGVNFVGPETGVTFNTGADTYTPLMASGLCSSISFLTAHTYGPDGSGNGTIGALSMWAAPTMQTEVTGMPVNASIVTCGKGLRLTESGSSSNLNVGNTLAGAIYEMWEMILLAQNGWIGVNFHSGDLTASSNNGYNPVWNDGSNNYSAKPTLYAMRMFQYLQTGNVLPATTNTLPATIPALCVLIGGATKCLIANKSLTAAVGVLVGTTSFSSCSTMMLTGSSYLATSVTLGGATISTLGAFSPTSATVAKMGSTCPIWIPASSAVLVTLT